MDGANFYEDGKFFTLHRGVDAILDDSVSCEDIQKICVLISIGVVRAIYMSLVSLDIAQHKVKRDISEETEVKPQMVDACSDTSDLQPLVVNACCDTGDLIPSMVDISCSIGDLITVANFAWDNSDLKDEPPKNELHNLFNSHKCHIVKHIDEDEFGCFEKHTKGFGSKLMKKMDSMVKD